MSKGGGATIIGQNSYYLRIKGEKMSYGKQFIISFLSLCFFLFGCTKQEQLEAVDNLCVESLDKEYVMEKAEGVLAGMHFGIDKADVSAGYIRTQPLEGGQFFEFWRQDNMDSYSFSESNLHSLRRIVELEFQPQNGQVCVEGTARTYRLSLPESENINVTQASEVFTRDQSRLLAFELSEYQRANISWVELGEDEALKSEILHRIESSVQNGPGVKE